MIEIRNLRTLVKIAELGSYTKAAQALGYAQSTLTFQVGAIESYYNCPVFDRTGKMLKLTAFGEQLLEYSNSVLREYDNLEQLGRSDAIPQGCLRIGAPESLTLYRLYPLIIAYKAAYPQVEVRMINSPCELLIKDLSAGQLDISFVLQPECMDENLHTELLLEEKMCLVAPAGHTQPEFLPESGEMVFYTEKECSYRQEFERYLQKHHYVPTNVLETANVEAIKKYVTNGLGVSYLPYYTVKSESESGLIRTKFIETDPVFFTQIVYHKKKWISPAIKALINLSREYGRKWSV